MHRSRGSVVTNEQAEETIIGYLNKCQGSTYLSFNSFRAKKRKRILDCDGDTPTGVTSLAESKENHSGLTQEIMALELTQNTPKRMSLHPTPDRRKNPLKGVLKKRYFFICCILILGVKISPLIKIKSFFGIHASCPNINRCLTCG